MKHYIRAAFAFVLGITLAGGHALAGDFNVFTPPPHARVVYVSSSSGNDNNNGLSPQTPKRTLAAGKALMRNGFPDWLRLKEGDVWTESFGSWDKSGESKAYPMVITYYRNSGATGGVTRPVINVPGQGGRGLGMWGSATIKHLTIYGLHFYGKDWNGTPNPQHGDFAEAISIHAPTENINIAYNYFKNFGIAVVLTNSGVKKATGFFRNIFDTNYINGNFTAGAHIYAQSCQGLRAEENILRNGGVNPANVDPETRYLIYRRGIYGYSHSTVDSLNCYGVKWIKNLVSNNASGDNFRAGGVVIGNVYTDNPQAFLIGGGHLPNSNGVPATAMYNVITEGKDMPPSNYPVGHNLYHENRRGWGITLDNVISGKVIENILTNNYGNLPGGIHASEENLGVRNVEFKGNVINNWKAGLSVNYNANSFGLQFFNNRVKLNTSHPTFIFQNQNVLSWITGSGNLAMNTQTNGNNVQVGNTMTNLTALNLGQTGNPNFPNPNVSIGNYMGTVLNYPTVYQNSAAFMDQAILNSKPEAWDDRFLAIKVVNYFRGGFGLPPRGQ